jgi:hypothetical protein
MPIVPSEGAINGAPDVPRSRSGEPEPPASTPPVDSTIALTRSFRPDPIVRRGLAGGPVPADRLVPTAQTSDPGRCVGFFSEAPSYELKLEAPIPDLRVLVHSEGDATLVIALADNRYLCDDDHEGLDPVIEGAFPAGRHRVWVGTFQRSGIGTPYTIGFTRQASLSTHGLASLPTTP